MNSEMIVVENGGIGYRVRVPKHVLDEAVVGQEIMLHTYFYVREDAMNLYGFSSPRELETFEILLTISGIGPKAALSVLSTMSVEDLYYAVFKDDVKAVTQTPGIGPKGARRMIMELKDKLDMEEITADPSFDSDKSLSSDPAEMSSPAAEAMQALVALGYSRADAGKAIRKIPDLDTMETEAILKAALKYIF